MPPLYGPQAPVVLHPVALGDDEVAVVEAQRDLDGDLPVRGGEHRVQLVVEADDGGGLLEVAVDRLERRQALHAIVVASSCSGGSSPGAGTVAGRSKASSATLVS